jgi:hypothetical protein
MIEIMSRYDRRSSTSPILVGTNFKTRLIVALHSQN